MKTIRMLSDEIGADGEPLPKGSTQTLNYASADRWLKRGAAVEEVAADQAALEAAEAAARCRADGELISAELARREAARAKNTSEAAKPNPRQKEADGGATPRPKAS